MNFCLNLLLVLLAFLIVAAPDTHQTQTVDNSSDDLLKEEIKEEPEDFFDSLPTKTNEVSDDNHATVSVEIIPPVAHDGVNDGSRDSSSSEVPPVPSYSLRFVLFPQTCLATSPPYLWHSSENLGT